MSAASTSLTNRPVISALALAALLVVVLLPMAALLVYGLTGRWDRHWWPEDPTLRWIVDAVVDPRVQGAVLRTTLLALASATLALVCGALATIPAALAVQLDDGPAARRLQRTLDLVALLPFAIAPVVIAISALELFVGRWGGWLPLPLVYVAVVAPTLFPLIHKTLQSALAQLNAASLIEACDACCCPCWRRRCSPRSCSRGSRRRWNSRSRTCCSAASWSCCSP